MRAPFQPYGSCEIPAFSLSIPAIFPICEITDPGHAEPRYTCLPFSVAVSMETSVILVTAPTKPQLDVSVAKEACTLSFRFKLRVPFPDLSQIRIDLSNLTCLPFSVGPVLSMPITRIPYENLSTYVPSVEFEVSKGDCTLNFKLKIPYIIPIIPDFSQIRIDLSNLTCLPFSVSPVLSMPITRIPYDDLSNYVPSVEFEVSKGDCSLNFKLRIPYIVPIIPDFSQIRIDLSNLTCLPFSVTPVLSMPITRIPYEDLSNYIPSVEFGVSKGDCSLNFKLRIPYIVPIIPDFSQIRIDLSNLTCLPFSVVPILSTPFTFVSAHLLSAGYPQDSAFDVSKDACTLTFRLRVPSVIPVGPRFPADMVTGDTFWFDGSRMMPVSRPVSCASGFDPFFRYNMAANRPYWDCGVQCSEPA